MATVKKVVYLGHTPESCCDHCGKQVGETVYDARTIWGPWGTLCGRCFVSIGVGLGIGRGQQYRWDEAEKEMVKVRG